MSNANALATVTATLASVLAPIAHDAWPGSRIFIGRPERRADAQRDQPAINIFLYQATFNPNWRNADAPTRDGKGRLVQRPAVGLDLNFMLTFYGPGFVPQLLLGHTISRLHARPLLSRSSIESALSQTDSIAGDAVLLPSDLDQFEQIRLSPVHFTLDELSRLWSVFFQTPYDLSIAYQASVVLVEATDEIPLPALPVQAASYGSTPGAIPQLEQVIPPFVSYGATEIRLRGRNIAAAGARVRFGGLDAPAEAAPAGAELVVRLPQNLAAGIIPVSVDVGGGLTSNSAAFMYRPVITAIDATRAPDRQITLRLQPAVQPGQRGLLLLNERVQDVLSDRPRRAYALPLAPPAAPTDTLTCDAAAVQPGVYLARVQIDGAESALTPPPEGSTDQAFAGPTVTAP